MDDFQIAIQKKFRVSTLGSWKDASTIWIVLHGYGQLSSFFIKKWNELSFENTAILAPEGMHRFYLNGTSGRVGASWMTKEWREQDIIENNLQLTTFLDSVKTVNPLAKISVLGFSQGGATLARWVSQSNFSFENFVLWASVFPPDMLAENNEIAAKNKYFVIGKEDEFYSTIQQEEIILSYKEMGFETIHFEGKHNIDLEIFNTIAHEDMV